MSYSTLMVHMDVEGSNDARLLIAGELAERFDSRLIGIAASDIQPLYFMDGAAAQDALEQDRARLKSQFSECEAQFRRVLKARADNIEWRSALDWPTDYVVRNARAADLIIAGGQGGRSDITRKFRRSRSARRPPCAGRAARSRMAQTQQRGGRLDPRGTPRHC